MVRLLLLVGLLAAITGIDDLAPQIVGWSYASRLDAQAEAPTRAVVRRTRKPAIWRTDTTDTDDRMNAIPAAPTAASVYEAVIRHHAARSAVPVDLVRAVIQAESGFDATARSPVGAMGLMQLMPQTATELGVVDPYDPEENIRGGVTYLKHLLRRYGGDEVLALAAYNAGPATVTRYGNRVPPYPETRRYVAMVRAVARGRAATSGATSKSYAIIDGRWTTVHRGVPSSPRPYETFRNPS